MQCIIISDLHIGSSFCRRDELRTFLDQLPGAAELILNGDVIDNPGQKLHPADQHLLDLITAQSGKRAVVWIWGNHDDGFRPPEPGAISFRRDYAVGQRLLVAHGHDFDNVMPQHRWFILLFRQLHALRMRLGAPPVHVAQYAKKWAFLYRFLRRKVKQNATEHARRNGFAAVACGHVHATEDSHCGGCRYLNTGAWTESPNHCLLVTDSDITLLRATDLSKAATRTHPPPAPSP